MPRYNIRSTVLGLVTKCHTLKEMLKQLKLRSEGLGKKDTIYVHDTTSDDFSLDGLTWGPVRPPDPFYNWSAK